MDAKSINFGNEIREYFRCQGVIPKKNEEKLVKFMVLSERLYIILEQRNEANVENSPMVELLADTEHQKRLIKQIEIYKDRTLLVINNIEKKGILISAFIIPQVISFEDNEEFVITIDIAAEMDLRRQRVTEKPSIFFKNQFLLEDKCFALINDENPNIITLIGNDYFCKLHKTSQNYINVIEVRRRRSGQPVRGVVTLLKGNISFVDQLSDKSQLAEKTNRKYSQSLKDNNSLLKTWRLYNDLELEAVKQDVNEMGYVEYRNYEIVTGENQKDKINFYLEQKIKSDFLTSNLGYSAVAKENLDKEDISMSIRSIYLGDEVKLSQDRKCLSITCCNEIIDIPQTGYIIGACQGSKIMNDRRKKAQLDIESCRAPLTDLKLILQTGEVQDVHIKKVAPVNDNLLKKIFGSKKLKFTERQMAAIDAAINTPDIAIIQGPPGTGKTTIIKAIIARLDDLYGSNIKILVSSAQHDAVDNAIENIVCGGLPVNRLGGKMGNQQDKNDKYIWKWLEELNNKCDAYLDTQPVSRQRDLMREVYLSIETCKKNINDKELLKHELNKIYSSLVEMNVGKNLLDKVYEASKELQKTVVEDTRSDNESIAAELIKIIDSQRLDVDSFFDDGTYQVAKLIRFIRLNEDEIKFEIPESWDKLRRYMEKDQQQLTVLLEEYVKDLERLRIAFSHKESTTSTDNNKNKIIMNNLFDEVINVFDEIRRGSKDQIADIIWEFKDQLNSRENINEIINKYTKVNAATCQQAASKKINLINDHTVSNYDYVIIDEAARANPLDLLIPMSMGKKIILVGDHKQLPHLLESDVVKMVIEKKNDPEVEQLLEESLFARLYTNIDHLKSIRHKRTVMLKEQYRMHPVIGRVVSQFYDEALIPGVEVKEREHHLGLYNNMPIAWLNVPRSKGVEESVNRQSKYRTAEIERIMEEVYKILNINPSYSIGIITFYKKQATLIEEKIEQLSLQDQQRISVGTVDAFQGKEFDIAILSTVRCNTHKDSKQRVGFLDSANRLCVAFSRGKRLLLVVGDYETVASDGVTTYVKPLETFYQLCKREGYYE